VYAPSLFECHADHLALGAALARAASRFPDLRIMIFGVNTAVPASEIYNISGHRARKDRALDCYKSQIAFKDLVRMSRALDAARTINIPDAAGVTDCEGFLVVTGRQAAAYVATARAVRNLVHPDGPENPK
jgi:LmbE family N-acetylglucosaminyl deacetylase